MTPQAKRKVDLDRARFEERKHLRLDRQCAALCDLPSAPKHALEKARSER
jgi:hypothetical protein